MGQMGRDSGRAQRNDRRSKERIASVEPPQREVGGTRDTLACSDMSVDEAAVALTLLLINLAAVFGISGGRTAFESRLDVPRVGGSTSVGAE